MYLGDLILLCLLVVCVGLVYYFPTGIVFYAAICVFVAAILWIVLSRAFGITDYMKTLKIPK